jgi:hypothetical protein
MRYIIDDRVLAAWIQTLCPEYIAVRALSEAQQFLATNGRAVRVIDQIPDDMKASSLADQMKAEGQCPHDWVAQPGGYSTCSVCGAFNPGGAP